MATAIFWPAQQTNQRRLLANLFNFCIFYLILIKFGLGAKWVVLNHSGDFWMSFWTAQAFQPLLPTSNWQQSSSSSKFYDFSVGESRPLFQSMFLWMGNWEKTAQWTYLDFPSIGIHSCVEAGREYSTAWAGSSLQPLGVMLWVMLGVMLGVTIGTMRFCSSL